LNRHHRDADFFLPQSPSGTLNHRSCPVQAHESILRGKGVADHFFTGGLG
jgi:hypothetical protein